MYASELIGGPKLKTRFCEAKLKRKSKYRFGTKIYF